MTFIITCRCFKSVRYSHPTSMTNIVNPFSMSVFGATFPKPTLVRDVQVKYRAVMYRDLEFIHILFQ